MVKPLTRLEIMVLFAEVVDNLPYRAFQVDNDFNLTISINLGIKNNKQDEYCLTLTCIKGNLLEVNLMGVEEFSKVQAFLIEEPKDNLIKLQLGACKDVDIIVNYFLDYLKTKGISNFYYAPKIINLKQVVVKYFKEKYTYMYFEPHEGLYIDNASESGTVSIQGDTITIL